MGTRRIQIFEVGANHVASATLALRAGRLVLERFASESIGLESSPDPWPARVAQSLETLTVGRDSRGPCAIVLPGHLVLTKCVRMPRVREKGDRGIASHVAEHIPLPLEEVVWGHRILGESELESEVVLVVARIDAIQPLCDATDSAGWRCEQVVPGSLALYEAFRLNYPEVSEPVIVANIGARTTHVLFAAGERFHVRTFELGGNAITEAVAQEMGIDIAAAESLKLQVLGGDCNLAGQSPSRMAVESATATFCARWQLEVRRTVAGWNRQRAAAAPTTLYLAGRGALLPGLAEAAAEKLTLPVKRYEPLRNVEISAAAQVGGPDSASAELIGVAAWILAKRGPGMNLLPPDRAGLLAVRQRQFRCLVAVTSTIGLSLIPIAHYHQRATATLAMTREIEREIAPLRLRQVENENHLGQIEIAKKRIAALNAAYEARTSWVAFLAELQGKLTAVENVWLDQLKVEERQNAREPGGSDPGTGKLFLSGRLLDVDNPRSKVSAQSFERVKQLMERLAESPFVSAIGGERFDNSQDGLLRFEVTLVLNPARPL